MVIQRAELDQDDKPKWIALMITMIIAGTAVFGAQDIVEWISGTDLDGDDESNKKIPEFVKDMADRGLVFLRYIGGIIVVVGMIIGAIKL